MILSKVFNQSQTDKGVADSRNWRHLIERKMKKVIVILGISMLLFNCATTKYTNVLIYSPPVDKDALEFQ